MSSESPVDHGLLSPVTAGHDDLVSDRAVLVALVEAEVALVRAYGDVGLAPQTAVDAASRLDPHAVDAAALAGAAVVGGNPVIPLVGTLKQALPEDARAWLHRGATSQDILDTALMIVAARAVIRVRSSLVQTAEALRRFAASHRDDVVAARTLTQHAVPTTMGLRATTWIRAIDRALGRLDALELPAQLGGAGGTLASFVEITGSSDAARDLVAAFARHAGLAAADAPWHVTRWPVTELGDALVQSVDAVGKLAADVATLGRTEIGELAEGSGGGSSAMPQKQNPVASVLIRSAALRAPGLGSTLHLAAALAADERPDGAWHAEWPTLRELLRLALGASAHAASLADGLRFDADAAARNLAATGGLVLSERLSIVLGPVLGPDAVAGIVAEVGSGAVLADAVRRALAAGDADLDVAALLDPAGYTGLAASLVDEVTTDEREEPA
ncbi:lyase family protein [Microbacterium mangrovi]|uniref:lyase family protein n=1 Tax=Microbacterium mangrovi TaxID=1348253 RepID=UPI00069240A6|nr:lyase family protein [Microbacterium mangrovi]